MFRSFCTTLIACGLTAAASTAALAADATSGANASDANAGSETLQEVVVTARRRSEDIESVPLTVTAVTPDTIQSADMAPF
jgi:iron complex outermembrane receptor protein